ncbi:MAG: guanylate kinase [Anaerolineae bacterium]|nr:guanylate kinase [Anaerolineae bacterium]
MGDVDVEPYLHPGPLVVVLSGPSGAGKDASIARMKELGYPFHFVVTATTRPQRPGEVHGVDYLFCSRREFQGMIDRGELFEHAVVYGEYKGIPKEQVRRALASGRDVIIRVDVQGAARLRELMPEAVLVFVTASSERELAQRLCARATEGEEALRRRVATARAEMKEIHRFDYVVVNRDGELDCTVQRILAIVQAEKSRARPRKVSV